MLVSVAALPFLAESIAMGIKRNGHATILAQEPELLEEFVKNGVTGRVMFNK